MYKCRIVLMLFALLSLAACRKKPLPVTANPTPTPVPEATTGTITFKINNVVGARPLVLGDSALYALPNGDSFMVHTFNYYLSNMVLTTEQGLQFVVPESYYLLRAGSPESLQFVITDVPFGNYKSIDFLIGVDSVRNFSGAQTGALDPQYGMIWSWNTGYIMAKMEGYSPQSGNPNKSISFHIAGFKGAYNVIQSQQFALPSAASVSASHNAAINMTADAAIWFQAPAFPGFASLSDVGVEGAKAYNISLNYASMLRIDSVH
ncbi:MAG: hypothetical protein IT256_02040 [Chitinophagaceae bacterium]|nr:hypothetical protein [Chitinophagaceae bacterium]